MTASYPLPTLAAQITSSGIGAPAYADILGSLVASYQSIYGADAYLAPDSQDGQFLAILAQAIYDTNQMAIAVYNAFAPGSAQGAGLSSLVKINGLQRLVATYSTATVTIVGAAGTTINNGIVSDSGNVNQWYLPAVVSIPYGGSASVTATCGTLGAVSALAGTLTKIVTPAFGWQSVTNPSAAVPGAPVETDAALRRRQSSSVAVPAQTRVDALWGALENLSEVLDVVVYENATSTTDSNGAPGPSIYAVVYGTATAASIAALIALYKTPGTPTWGTTSQAVVDANGVPSTINFYEATAETILVAVVVRKLVNWNSTLATAIAASLSSYISGLPIGATVYWQDLYGPAYLNGGAGANTYTVTALQISIGPASTAAANITLAFNQVPICLPANVSVSVTS